MSEQNPTIGVERIAQSVSDVKYADPGLSSFSFDDLGKAVKFAELMSRAGEMLPEHLRMKPALCLGVTVRAVHWKFDPYALAAETYQAKSGGIIGYQAKVFVAALRNMRGIRLKFRYEGDFKFLDKAAMSAKGNQVAPKQAVGDLRCIAYATVDGEVLEYETPTLDQIAIKNSPGWHNTPRDQLSYYAGRGWVRLYEPGVIMGAYADEEVETMAQGMRDVTPEPKVDAFAAIAQKARQAEKAEPAADHAAEDAGEPAAHWTEDYDPLDAIPGSKEWAWGEESATDPDHTARACPFEQGTQEAEDWLGGFIGKRRAME